MKLYLVRHGQTAWNAMGRYQGTQDIPLDAEGIEQSKLLAKRLEGITWGGAISSDLMRAKQTAETALGSQSDQLQIWPEFREMNFGTWEGQPFEKVREDYPEEVNQFLCHPGQVRIPGGETAEEVQERVVQGIEKMKTLSSPSENWLVTSHGGTIRTLLCALMGKSLDEMWNIHQGNTAINILIYTNGKWEVECVNDTSHLK